MLRRVRQYIREQDLLHEGDSVVVALSGGADSVALLDVLLRAGYRCIAAHCNFHLRGEESDRDELFVRRWCEEIGVELVVQHFDTKQEAREKGVSIEMAARDLRYAWFEQVRAEKGCDAIAVAHHQNDQAETVLLNLKRGSGLRGLTGMHAKNGRIVRPLLCTTRAYIEHYCKDIRHLDYVTDSTNADTSIKRNAIRSWLSTAQQSEIEHIAETAERMHGYEQLVEAYVAQVRGDIVTETPNGMVISIERLRATVAPNIVLYELVKEYGFQTDELYKALLDERGGKVFEGKRGRAQIRKGKIVVDGE